MNRDTKTCNGCKQDLPLSSFYRYSDSGYYYSLCHACKKASVNESDRRKRARPGFREEQNAYNRMRRSSETSRATERRHAAAYRIRYPEKEAAKVRLMGAIRRGKIIRPERCEICGEVPPPLKDGRSRVHGHHHDYTKPLDVVWLCQSCHITEHRRMLPVSEEEV